MFDFVSENGIFDINSDLKSCKYNNLPEYELDGCHDCKIVRIWDGDTLFAAIRYKDDKIYRVCCRILDVDTPEIPRNHDYSMSEESKKAYLARDRIVELLTNVDTNVLQRPQKDTLGKDMPSLTSHDLQPILDTNTLVLAKSLTLHGRDKYGRYLVRIKTKTGEDLSETLINEGLCEKH